PRRLLRRPPPPGLAGRLMALEVAVVETIDDALVGAVNGLLPQLSSRATALSRDELAAVASADATTMFVARDGDAVVGMLTLAVFAIPTGVRAWIEDVVVDEGARGRGVGEALVAAAIARARSVGARTLDLTSNRSREAAHRLYQRSGFEVRETSVYRLGLE
ncbi:MAG TPA: GNAT family N-acetyltransferase, partial [Acidimicrobiales bacterium]|nr:GNAT family N-acetyltransferase [Acidimicrobiales bacterium]